MEQHQLRGAQLQYFHLFHATEIRMVSNCVALHESCHSLNTVSFFVSFFFFQEKSKQERANLDIVWQLENKNKEIQTLNARVQKVSHYLNLVMIFCFYLQSSCQDFEKFVQFSYNFQDSICFPGRLPQTTSMPNKHNFVCKMSLGNVNMKNCFKNVMVQDTHAQKFVFSFSKIFKIIYQINIFFFYKTKVAYKINAIYLFQDHVSIILCFTRNLIIPNTRDT